MALKVKGQGQMSRVGCTWVKSEFLKPHFDYCCDFAPHEVPLCSTASKFTLFQNVVIRDSPLYAQWIE